MAPFPRQKARAPPSRYTAATADRSVGGAEDARDEDAPAFERARAAVSAVNVVAEVLVPVPVPVPVPVATGSRPDCIMVFILSTGAVAVLETAPATPPLASLPASASHNPAAFSACVGRSLGTVYSPSASSTKLRWRNASKAAAALAPSGRRSRMRANSSSDRVPLPSRSILRNTRRSCSSLILRPARSTPSRSSLDVTRPSPSRSNPRNTSRICARRRLANASNSARLTRSSPSASSSARTLASCAEEIAMPRRRSASRTSCEGAGRGAGNGRGGEFSGDRVGG